MQQDGWPGFRAGIVGIIIGGLLMTAFPVSGAVGEFPCRSGKKTPPTPVPASQAT